MVVREANLQAAVANELTITAKSSALVGTESRNEKIRNMAERTSQPK
jgi:hypothetical protein